MAPVKPRVSRRMMQLLKVGAFPAPLLSCCMAWVSVHGVLQDPIPRGHMYRYATPPDTLAAAATRAFTARGFRVARDTMNGSTRLVVGTRGATLMGWGEIGRAAITATAELTEVRMISRPRLRFALHNDRSPRLFQALDRELGDGGPQPSPATGYEPLHAPRPD